MRRFVEGLDVSLSFTNAARGDVDLVRSRVGEAVSLYDYRQWLDQQIGANIEQLAASIYTTMPCIVFATRDWFIRPATLLEQRFLALNAEPKLVIDYAGEFATREAFMGIRNVRYGKFVDDTLLDLDDVVAFLKRCFPTI